MVHVERVRLISELRLRIGVLFNPQVMYEYGEPRWNNIDKEKPNNWEKSLSEYHFVFRKPHVD
jgi:hypothetical protein